MGTPHVLYRVKITPEQEAGLFESLDAAVRYCEHHPTASYIERVDGGEWICDFYTDGRPVDLPRWDNPNLEIPGSDPGTYPDN